MSKRITTVIDQEAIEKEFNWLRCSLKEVHEKMQSLKKGNTELRMWCVEQAVKAAGPYGATESMIINNAIAIEKYVLKSE